MAEPTPQWAKDMALRIIQKDKDMHGVAPYIFEGPDVDSISSICCDLFRLFREGVSVTFYEAGNG